MRPFRVPVLFYADYIISCDRRRAAFRGCSAIRKVTGGRRVGGAPAGGYCRGFGGDFVSIGASSGTPEMLSGSSSGSYIGPGAGACRTWVDARCSELIRQSGSLPRPRRTGAAGRSAALATGWPFQRLAAAGLWTQRGARQRLERVSQRKLWSNAISKELAKPSYSDGRSVGKNQSTQAGPTPQWAPDPAHAPPSGLRRPPRACRA